MKKVLSLVLVIAMVLSSMSFAFAAKFEDIADTDYADAIEALTALGVVTGYEDGTYRPENIVTRAEMAKLMVQLLGYGDLVSGSKSNFVDTQGHWADAWIALAAGRGIVIGDGNGTFRPDAQVTYNEVLTMLVRGLGYTDDCNELKGMSWPTNFKVKAAELDITDGVVMNTTGADRGGVAQAMYNALESTLVTVTIDGDVTFLQDTFDGEEINRKLITRVATPNYNYIVSPERLDPSNKNYGGDLVDLAPYMFQNLDVFLNDDKDVVYIDGTNSLVYEGTVDKVETTWDLETETPGADDETTLKVENASGKILKIIFEEFEIDSAKVFENGSIRETGIDFADLKDTDSIKVVAFDDDKDGKIDEGEVDGYVTTLQTDVVRIEKEYVEGKDSLDGLDLPLDDDDEVNLANITVKGAVDSLEDIEIDDVVVEYLSEDETVTTLVVTRETVEGKVTRVEDANTVYVDGVKYDIADLSIVGNDFPFTLGTEGVFFLNHEGKIADYDGESAGPTDYAVVIGSGEGEISDRFGISIKTYPELKLATQDGESVVYELELKLNSDGTVDKSADYTPVGGDATALFVDADVHAADGGDDKIVIGEFDNDLDYLVKYSLNKDGRISDIEVIREVTDAADDVDADYDQIDLDKATNKLLADAVIFDGGDKYDVVDADALGSKVRAFAVRNSKGEIEVLVVENGEIDAATDVIFAYIYNIDPAFNDDGDKVQYLGVYTDNADKGIYTIDNGMFGTEEKVYAIKYDGEVIDTVALDYDEIPTYSSAGTGTAGLLTGGVVTASAVNAKGGMVEFGDDNWFAMSEHGTVIVYDESDEAADDLADLYDIKKGVSELMVYVNKDGEIDLILIMQP